MRADNRSDTELAMLLIAAATAGVPVDISASEKRAITGVEITIESDQALAQRLVGTTTDYASLRAPGASDTLHRAANEATLQLIDSKVLANARIELTHYLPKAIDLRVHPPLR